MARSGLSSSNGIRSWQTTMPLVLLRQQREYPTYPDALPLTHDAGHCRGSLRGITPESRRSALAIYEVWSGLDGRHVRTGESCETYRETQCRRTDSNPLHRCKIRRATLQPCLTGCRARCLRRRRRQRRVSLLQRFRLTALRTVRSVFVDGLFRKRRPLDLEQTTETAWTTITLAIRQVNS
jgi:hypothetical protein